MSGIALVFRRDGAPVAPAELEAMTAAMAHRAVDGVRHEIDGPVGVGFCSMVTTPEARNERQPIRCRGGSTIVAMDGRLDDRRTLRTRLGGTIAPDAGDAEFLGRAIERWGAGFVNHLIGDFAIVVADPTQRRVVCARDHLGVKPLYYASVGPHFVAASDVRAVLAHPAVPDDIDPEAFDTWAEYWVVPEGTIYHSVSVLPMGSMLVVTSKGVVGPTRHWDPSCEPDRSSTPAALVEEYRWLATEAVRDRLRSSGPVVVSMSGGLDSTAVASMAVALSRQEPGQPGVRIASLIFPGHPRADESKLIDLMELSLGSPVRRVRPTPRSPADLAAEIERYRELPDVPNDQLGSLLQTEHGERVLLTGLGGDDWFYNSRGHDVTLAMRHGRWLSAVAAARRGVADGRHTSTARALWRYGLRPLARVPGTLAGRSRVLSSAIGFVGGQLGRRFLEVTRCPPGVPFDTIHGLNASRDPILAARLAVIERRAARDGFDYRHPLHDVRLVELSLRLPGRLRMVDGDARWLPRQAMLGSLPEEIRRRQDKAEFSLSVREELEVAAITGLLTRAAATAEDPERTRRQWNDIRAADADTWHPALSSLWSAAVLQAWKEADDGRLAPSG